MSAIYQNGVWYAQTGVHSGFTPVGTVISVMGVTAPMNYLACDGQIVNISDYPELALYFETQFGDNNHFGGDGTITFAVPDLRGEFLRGTGTNSHTNQGNGASVGVHQDGTEHTYLIYGTGNSQLLSYKKNNDNVPLLNWDTLVSDSTQTQIATATAYGKYSNRNSRYTSRPTNTSVLYCIATKNIFMDAGSNYSLEEQVVGTWIDGKPLYQKTYQFTTPSAVNTKTSIIDIDDLNCDHIFILDGEVYDSAGKFSLNHQDEIRTWFRTPDGTTNKDQIAVEVLSSNRRSKPAYITIRYTKTTD